MDVDAGELSLHPLSAEEAERVLRHQRAPGELWASDYPSIEQVDFLEAYLVEARSTERAHYWQSQIRRASDGLIVGGAGVSGPPDDEGAVTIGYELGGGVGDAQHGTHVVNALIGVARSMKAQRVTTDVFDDDFVRRQAYLDSGLVELRHEGRIIYLGGDI